MLIRIRPSSGVPITGQIADQIRTHCASGTLEPGDRLPSVRELARELAVNPNTILRVYERLTAEGLLERRHGDGTFVAESLPRGQAKAQRVLLRDEIERLVQRALDLGVECEQVVTEVQDGFARARKSLPATQKGGAS